MVVLPRKVGDLSIELCLLVRPAAQVVDVEVIRMTLFDELNDLRTRGMSGWHEDRLPVSQIESTNEPTYIFDVVAKGDFKSLCRKRHAYYARTDVAQVQVVSSVFHALLLP